MVMGERIFSLLVLLALLALAGQCLAAKAAVSDKGLATLDSSGLVVLTQGKARLESHFEGGKLKKGVMEKINSEAEKAPMPLLALVDNKKVNVYVTLDDGTVKSYWLSVAKGKLDDAAVGARSEAGFEARLDESTLDALVNSKEPFGLLLESVNSGKIKYVALSNEGKPEEFVVKAGAKIGAVISRVLGFLNRLFR